MTDAEMLDAERYWCENCCTMLHIINNNIPALSFWQRIFKLREIGHNKIDTLYEILGLKEGSDT